MVELYHPFLTEKTLHLRLAAAYHHGNLSPMLVQETKPVDVRGTNLRLGPLNGEAATPLS